MNGYWGIRLLLLAICLLVLVPSAGAQDEELLTAILTLEQPEPTPVGTRPTINAQLLNEEGRPIPNMVLILYVNDEQVRRIRTDESGEASIYVSRDFPVGTYRVDVIYSGTQAYRGTSASLDLTIRPIQLTVETVPPIANITLSLDGQTFVTDSRGLAQIDISEPDTYTLQVLDVSDVQVSEDVRVSFVRWGDSVFQPERTVDALRDIHLQVGFTTSYRVGLSFVDLDGNEVDPERISSAVFRRSDGGYVAYETNQARWLEATQIARRPEGLEATQNLYSLESLLVDGANTVNRYQQRFYVQGKETWELQLLLYHARIYATDAVFGFQIGKGVSLEYPDGRIEELQFGDNQDVYIAYLARGQYYLRATGALGIAPVTPLSLTKDQVVELKVLTAFDIGLGATLGAGIVFGLLFYGRPRILVPLLTSLRRARHSAAVPMSSEIRPQAATVAETPTTATPGAATLTTAKVTASAASATSFVPGKTPSRPEVEHGNKRTSESEDELYVSRLTRLFHPNGLKCPHCGGVDAHVVKTNKGNKLKVYSCMSCKRTYNLYTKTPFSGSRLTPRQGIRLLRGIAQAPAQLATELGLTKKTVLKWQRRLRAAGIEAVVKWDEISPNETGEQR